MSDGLLTEIPTQPDTPHPLGRSIINHDPRNRDYRAVPRSLLAAALPSSKTWYAPPAYNQVDDNCTMEAFSKALVSSPLTTLVPKTTKTLIDTEQERVALYKRSQQFDPWPGEDYGGTSSDAPAKLFMSLGKISRYEWIFGVDELKAHILGKGPAMVGTYWYNSMWETNAQGYLHVDIDSGIAGGHEWLVIGYSAPRDAFRMVNSWGTGWGDVGRAWVPFTDMDRLLQADGDALSVVL